MEYFSGTVHHQLDAKNRIRIPAKFRRELGEKFYFMIGPQGCIAVYPEAALSERLEKLKEIRTGDPEKLRAKRLLQSSIEQVNEDDQNRTLLSSSLRTYAHITKDVVTVGMGDYLEIWAKEEFEKNMAQMTYDEAYALVDF